MPSRLASAAIAAALLLASNESRAQSLHQIFFMEAREFVSAHWERLNGYKPEVLEDYADEARITSKVLRAGARPIDGSFTGRSYRDHLQKRLATPPQSREQLVHDEVTSKSEGTRARLCAQRSVRNTQLKGTVCYLVGRARDNSWKIYEEHAQLRD
jgi:hypothetical protein